MYTLALCLLIFGVQLYAVSVEKRNFRIVNLNVPNHVPADQKDVDIICEYDGNFTVMSWFKGPREFFRYKPDHEPSTKIFATEGIGQIQYVFCGTYKCHLRLKDVTSDATGLYRCDIEREKPPYKFETRTAYMEIEGHEPRKPLLTGIAEVYTEGDNIQGFCRGDRDTELRWFINGKELRKNRGSPVLQLTSSRDNFIGINFPIMIVQCAELKYGKFISSNEMKAYWKERINPSKNQAEALLSLKKIFIVCFLIQRCI